jgi:hypothetical protein
VTSDPEDVVNRPMTSVMIKTLVIVIGRSIR